MKKPIDPNLFNDDEILIGLGEDEKSDFTINEEERAKPVDPNFIVTENIIATVNSEAKSASSGSAAGETHHRSSDSAHHHSSSSSSHHSSGSSHHHSSSGSHHSSGSSHHHSSSGSHHSSSSHSSKKKLPLPARIAIAIIIIILLLAVIAAGTFLVLRHMGRNDVMPTVQEAEYQEIIEYNGHKYKYNEDMFALGFIGVDKRQFEDAEDTDFVGAADADVVVAIDSKTGKASAIAIPRDSMVDINITTSSGVFVKTDQAQLCLAYAYGDGREGSCQNTLEAMSRILLNVPIEKYFALDMDGIAPLNDAIGGVTVTSLYVFPDYGFYTGATVTLRGEMSEMYVRLREMDRADASFRRVDRQIQYIKAYAQQALPAVVKDFSTVSSLYNTAMDYSQTNITLSNTTYLASLLLSKGVTDFDSYKLDGEVTTSPDPLIPGVVHAELYLDNDNVM